MKQIYLVLIALFISASSFSQLVLTANGSGAVDVSYGASADWSLYNPGADPVVLYMWVDTSMNSQNIFYGDAWGGTLINLTWDGSAHVGTINFNSYNWDNGGVMPTGTTLTDFNLILRNPAGNAQSGNLLATDYTYSVSVLPVEDFENVNINLFSFNNKINIKGLNSNENYSLSIFDTMGRQVKSISSNTDVVDISELHSAVYFLVLETVEGNTIRKKIIKQ
ncbi:MAG: hypothetical protein COB73_09485 [Flavobacteriaceae bacterium]|nr:MAG: hypothetical protein COB73_09485 [Flavobacteriaceae bacterium]